MDVQQIEGINNRVAEQTTVSWREKKATELGSKRQIKKKNPGITERINVQTQRKHSPAFFSQLFQFGPQVAALLLQPPNEGILGTQETIQLSNCNQ